MPVGKRNGPRRSVVGGYYGVPSPKGDQSVDLNPRTRKNSERIAKEIGHIVEVAGECGARDEARKEMLAKAAGTLSRHFSGGKDSERQLPPGWMAYAGFLCGVVPDGGEEENSAEERAAMAELPDEDRQRIESAIAWLARTKTYGESGLGWEGEEWFMRTEAKKTRANPVC